MSAAAVVLRGGISAEATLRDNAEVTLAMEGVWGISAFGGVEMDPGELADGIGLPHPKYRYCTVGELKAAGFDVEESPPPPYHVTIHLGDDADGMAIARLATVLGPVVQRQDSGGPE